MHDEYKDEEQRQNSDIGKTNDFAKRQERDELMELLRELIRN